MLSAGLGLSMFSTTVLHMPTARLILVMQSTKSSKISLAGGKEHNNQEHIRFRFQSSRGCRLHWVPGIDHLHVLHPLLWAGWDCHGLPIELKAIKGGKRLEAGKVTTMLESKECQDFRIQVWYNLKSLTRLGRLLASLLETLWKHNLKSFKAGVWWLIGTIDTGLATN